MMNTSGLVQSKCSGFTLTLIELIMKKIELAHLTYGSHREGSGRALNSVPKGSRFEPHGRHCVVVLARNIYPSLVLVQPRKTHPYITERLLMGR